MTYRTTGKAGAFAALAWIGLAWAGLGGGAAAQEGTGDPVFAYRYDEVQGVYPAAAKSKGLNGVAVVTCQSAERRVWGCALTSETPAGEGFGPAALAMVKRYEVAPRTQAVTGSRTITVQFVAPKVRVVHAGGAEYVAPLEVEQPSQDALHAAWPAAARFSGLEGSVDLLCTVTLEGRAKDCGVLSQRSRAQDLGPAALSVAPLYRFQPGRRNGVPVAMTTVVKVFFSCDYRCRPFEGARYQPTLAWRAAPSHADVLAAYPPSARQRGVKGLVRLSCMADDEGRLQDCRVIAETVKGEGFGEAALGLASAFRLEPPATSAASGARKKAPAAPVLTPQAVVIDFGTLEGRPFWMSMPYATPTPRPDGTPPVAGEARARCRVGLGGKLEGCEILSLTPAGDAGAEIDARARLAKVVSQLWTDEGRSTIGATVLLDVPVGKFGKPSIVAAEPDLPKPGPGVVDYRPLIRSGMDADSAARYYPDRAQRMEVGGKAELSCARIVKGRVEDCTLLSESPLEYGFGEAALKMSRLFRFSPETIDGAPVDEPILIPVNFSVPD
ncbi:hypothetical protein DMC25_17100 [Caulobacter sp. D4A]|nr:energy transducer TonB [Caulobacter sp. D4A]PXA84144.1 hypothetical protein DMC25_17100 [Caulobacter sp. D4A]